MPDNIFTLPSLIRWLREQPAKGRYDRNNSNTCMIAQFAQTHGRNYRAVPMNTLLDWEFEIAQPRPHRFGAALQRARALLASQRSTDAAVERIKADALAEREGV